MKHRAVSPYVAGLLAVGILGTGAYAYWQSGLYKVSVSHPVQSLSGRKHSSAGDASADKTYLHLLPGIPGPTLAWAPMEKHIDAPGGKTRRSVPGSSDTTITRATVLPPLNLQLPQEMAKDTELANLQSSTGRHEHRPPLALNSLLVNLNPNIDDRDRQISDDTHLFNKSSGLRGFMARNWINNNIGLQGGLAIKDTQLREDNSDLRDNMAVGMGLLFAF